MDFVVCQWPNGDGRWNQKIAKLCGCHMWMVPFYVLTFWQEHDMLSQERKKEKEEGQKRLDLEGTQLNDDFVPLSRAPWISNSRAASVFFCPRLREKYAVSEDARFINPRSRATEAEKGGSEVEKK